MQFITRTIFSIILVFSIVFILVYGGLLTLDMMRIGGNTEYIKNFLGAFLGAFFAFLFVIVGNFVSMIYKRRRRHRDAIVSLEYNLNELGSINFDNLSLLEGLIQSINEKLRYKTVFTPLICNKEILLNLGNIDLINDTFLLYSDIRKVNHSLEVAMSQYNDMWTVYLDKKIPRDNLEQNLSNLKKQLTELLGFLKSLDTKIEILSSKSTALYKCDETYIDWFLQLLSVKANYPKGFSDKYEKELEALRQSRQKIMSDSRKEIDKTLREAAENIL